MRRFVNVAVSLAATLALAGCKDQSLYSGLKREEANQIAVLLQASGIEATLSEDVRGETASVSVDQSQAMEAIEILTRAGLPRQKEGSLRDILPKDTWMATPLEERARLGYGLSQELTSTLTSIPGIVDSRVHLALAEKNALGETTADASASVLVRYDGRIMSGEFQENIKTLVANSVAGLSYERVTVTMVPYESEATLVAAGSNSAAPALMSRPVDSMLRILAVLAVVLAATSMLLRLIRVKK